MNFTFQTNKGLCVIYSWTEDGLNENSLFSSRWSLWKSKKEKQKRKIQWLPRKQTIHYASDLHSCRIPLKGDQFAGMRKANLKMHCEQLCQEK